MLVLQQSGEAEKGKPANQENAARFHATRLLWINVPPVACARPNCALKNGLSRHGALDFDKGRRMSACKTSPIKRPVARTPLRLPPPRVVLKSTGGMGTGSSCSLEKSARHWNTLRRALPFGGALPVNARAGQRQNPIYSVLVHKTASIRCTSQSRFHNIVPENEPLLKFPFV